MRDIGSFILRSGSSRPLVRCVSRYDVILLLLCGDEHRQQLNLHCIFVFWDEKWWHSSRRGIFGAIRSVST